MRFALIGKMDVNRDEKDDREELKRMIHEAGGVVDYDLPPTEIGKESGTLSPRIDWYVIDNRLPLRELFTQKSAESAARKSKLEQRMGEVIKEARLNGIRPLVIEKLLAYLGYDMNAPIVGRAQGIDINAMRRLTAPRKPGQAATKPATPSSAAPKTDEMKDEPKPDQPDGAADKKADTKKAEDGDNPK